MTECFPSPPQFNRFGCKRLASGNFYEDSIVDLSHSRNPFKRQKNCEINHATMASEESRLASINDVDCLSSSGVILNRDGDEFHSRSPSSNLSTRNFSQNHGSDNNLTEVCRAAVRAEFQLYMDQKDNAIAALTSSAQFHETALLESQTARGIYEEENRILKRGVAIQDGRQKELQGQNQQLQSVLLQAADHITNLERCNRELRMQLESGRGQYSFHSFDRPPDVF